MNDAMSINVDGSPGLMGRVGQKLCAAKEHANKAVCLLDARMRLLTAEPEGDAPLTLEVRYYVNEVRVGNFTPQQRLLAGAHTLALFYPFASVEANAAKRLSVRLVCTGGTVKIAPYSIKATVTGQGMASELPWDGTLQFEELLMPLQLTERKVILE